MERSALQRGVALIVSLVLLLVVTVAALSAARFSSIELLIARNDEYRYSAYHGAQSLVDATIASGLPARGNDGIATCSSTSITTPDCSGATALSLPTTIAPSADLSGGNSAKLKVVVRQVAHDLPTNRKMKNSGQHVRGARWVITASYDKTASGAGATQVGQGYYDEYAAGEQTTGSVE